ncbi:MAG: hypothetical protein IH987_12905, partial [Planctomycetes bacterium]|nr:hypothetical protein [Planctomycetota bacterium]
MNKRTGNSGKTDDGDAMKHDSQLIRRLERIRLMVRRRLMVYGVMAVVAGGIASFLAISTLDWLLRLPGLLRLAGIGMFLAGAAIATLHWVIRPLRAEIGVAEIARQLEIRFSSLRDRLSSTVHFLEHGSSDSESMTRRVIENTDATIAPMPLESALSLAPTARCGVWLLLSVSALGTILMTAPNWAQTGLYRYIHPFGAIEWPRAVQIVPMTDAEVVAIGESVTVRMAVKRGMRENLRAFVHVRGPDGEVVRLAAQQDVDGTFFAIIDAVTTDLEYWFEAGDADTGSHPFTIRVVRRPEVVAALADVAPPAYAEWQSHSTHVLTEGPVHAPVGGRVKITIRTSKPIPPGASRAKAGLRFTNGSYQPLESQASEPSTLTAELEILDDLAFAVELCDEEGFHNRGAAQFEIRAVPDTPPAVSIVAPVAVTESTPSGLVAFSIRVEDDLGISSLALDVERVADGEHRTVVLTDSLVASPDDAHAWLAKMDLHPSLFSAVSGDNLVCSAVATDNRPLPGAVGQVTRSTPVRIRIISEAEFDTRLRDELAALVGRLRRVLISQSELLDETRSLVRAGRDPPALTAVESERVHGMTGRQTRLVRRLQETARRFAELKARLERNKTGEATTIQTMEAVTESLWQIAGGEMQRAAGFLLAAGHPALPIIQQEALSDASRNQSSAVEQLRVLLGSMAQLGDFQALVGRTRDLIDRQDEIRSQTQHLGKSLLGKAIESLDAKEAAALRRVQRRQAQLAGDVGQLLARLQRSRATPDEQDPSGQEAIDDAIRAARTSKVDGKVKSAAEAIAGNRTAAASIDQKAAAAGLRKMLRALQKRQDRELDRLRKVVRDAASEVRQLLEEQTDLREATNEAVLITPETETLAELGDGQRVIGMNTRALGDELEERVQTFDAARVVRSAADRMTAAEKRLGTGDALSAREAQDQAIAELTEAIELLNALDRRVAKEEMRRTLGEIQSVLESMVQAERHIDDDVRVLHDTIQAKGRVSRSEARDAARLARDQHALRRQVEQWLPEFEKVKVFAWSLRRISEKMDRGRRQLDNRRIDEPLLRIIARIVRDLETLVQAIDETLNLPDREFAEAEESGSSGGRGSAANRDATKPVPTVTELMVLKSLQRDLVERTLVWHGKVAGLEPGAVEDVAPDGEEGLGQ